MLRPSAFLGLGAGGWYRALSAVEATDLEQVPEEVAIPGAGVKKGKVCRQNERHSAQCMGQSCHPNRPLGCQTLWAWTSGSDALCTAGVQGGGLLVVSTMLCILSLLGRIPVSLWQCTTADPRRSVPGAQREGLVHVGIAQWSPLSG